MAICGIAFSPSDVVLHPLLETCHVKGPPRMANFQYHQSQIIFVPCIYGMLNIYHHNSNMVFIFSFQPFMLAIPLNLKGLGAATSKGGMWL